MENKKRDKPFICACGEVFWFSNKYYSHRRKCEQYPWDDTDAEMEVADGKGR